MKDFFFPQPTDSKSLSLFLLAFRLVFGVLLMIHGFEKIYNYTELCFVFPNPTGIGSEISLLFVICTEILCSLAFILGAFYRLVMIPMLIVMATAFFHVHGGNIAEGELALIYLLVFIILYIYGPGEYAVDAKIYQRLHAKDDEAYEY